MIIPKTYPRKMLTKQTTVYHLFLLDKNARHVKQVGHMDKLRKLFSPRKFISIVIPIHMPEQLKCGSDTC